MSENVLAILKTLNLMRDKFETDLEDETKVEPEIEEKAESAVTEEVDGDGYQTIDLNAYSDLNLIPLDTGDTGDAKVIKTKVAITNGLEIDTRVAVDNEPDLDSTLIAGDHNDIVDLSDTVDHNDTGEHSDIDIDPLATSSQTNLNIENIGDSPHSASPLTDHQINIDQTASTDVKEGDTLTQSDIQAQPDLSSTESAPLSESVTRSKSKAIPPRSKSATQQRETEETQADISSSPSNSITSATSSSVGAINKISLSEPHSLERHTDLSLGSPLSLGGSLNFTSVTSSLKSRGKSDFAQRVETALNTQLSVSSVASVEGEDDLIAIPVSKGASGGGGESLGGAGSSGGKGKKKKSKRKKNPPSRRMSSPEIRG